MTMTMNMTSNLSARQKLILSAAVLLFVAACGGGGGKGIASLGSGFVKAFNAPSFSEPVDPDNISLTVDPTADPFNP